MASASSCFDDTRGGNETYGFLTWKGMHQMYHTGVAMADRYGPENSQNNGLLVRPGSSFRDLWDIEAFSTNYLRTVKSCQAFLDGLFNDYGSSSSSSSSGKIGDREALDYEPPTHYESIDDIAEYRRTRVDNSGGTNAVEIHVRDPKDETLNPWSSSPELMKNLMSDALETPESIENNRKAANLTRELSEYIPGLLKHSPTPTSGIKINWIHAADHFVCRSSHSVPVVRFCPHLETDRYRENSEVSEDHFRSLGNATLSHLLSRFRLYYSNQALLAEVAGPALGEVRNEMKGVAAAAAMQTESFRGATKKPFRVYSCHDVTILGLLYAIKDRFLGMEHVPAGDWLVPTRSSWPTYATCITLELVRLSAKGKKDDTFVVKAWLNEAPIPTFWPVPIPIVATEDAEPTCTIDLSDFDRLVRELDSRRVPDDDRPVREGKIRF